MNDDAIGEGELELRERLVYERALTSLLRLFVDAAPDAIDGAIDDALEILATVTSADRAFVYVTVDGEGGGASTGESAGASEPRFQKTNEWTRAGAPPSPFQPDELRTETLSRWWAAISNLEPVVITSASTLEPEQAGDGERDVLERGAVKALAAVPVVIRNAPVGCVGIVSSASEREWSRPTVALLEQVGGILAQALERRVAEEERRRSIDSLRRSEERFRRLVQHSPDVVIVVDALGTFSYASPMIEVMLGYRAEELIGTSALDLVHPDEIDDIAVALANTVTAAGETGDAVGVRVRHRDGTWVPVEVAGSSLVDDPVWSGIVVTVRDMRDNLRKAATIEEVEIRFRQIFDYSPIGIVLTTPDGRVIKANAKLAQMLGLTEEEVATISFREVTHPDDVAASNALYEQVARGEVDGFTIEKRYVGRDGSTMWVRVSTTAVRDAEGKTLYTIGHIEDITPRKQIEQRLSYDATHDSLTGLPLRTLVLDHLDLALANARRTGTRVAVLFIDLDRFKRVNDSLGHVAGDELLKEVALRLRSAVRHVDTPGRFGGDEFVVVCPDLDGPEDVVAIAERIRRRFEEPVELRGVQVFVGASIGIAVSEGPGAKGAGDNDAEALLRQADTAAYRAKDRGRNRYEIFDEELRSAVAQRLEVESGLRHALEHDELRLVYQPIVAIEPGTITGFEALVRWQRDGVLVGPAEFLDVAEETGLIVPLGEVVLEKACRQLAMWRRALGGLDVPRLSVNLSARQLTQPQLPEFVRHALESNGLTPDMLYLEITETVLMQDTPQVIQTIRELRELGVRLAIDDFGTGYSSLSYLRRLPVSAVKIDRSFILELGADREGSTIVASVISLAHALGMEIIAEGVETIEHVAALLNLGCDHAQGFYFSRPVLPDVVLTLLQHGVVPEHPAA